MNTHLISLVSALTQAGRKLTCALFGLAMIASTVRADHSEIAFVVPVGYSASFSTNITSTLIGYVDGRLYSPTDGEVASVWSMASPSGIQVPWPLPVLNLNSYAYGYHEDINWFVDNLPPGDYFLTIGGGEPYATYTYETNYALVDLLSLFYYGGENAGNPFGWSLGPVLSSLSYISWANTYAGDPSSLAEARSYSLDLFPTPTSGNDGSLYSFLVGTQIASNRTELETAVHNVTGWTIDKAIREFLDHGCIGLVKIICRVTLGNGVVRYPGLNVLPEEETNPLFGTAKAFLTLDAANASPCPEGCHVVLFAKYGAWKNGTPPTPDAEDGHVPLDCVTYLNEPGKFDYIVFYNGKWYGINHMKINETTDPQKMFEYETLPNPASGIARVIIKRCIPNNP